MAYTRAEAGCVRVALRNLALCLMMRDIGGAATAKNRLKSCHNIQGLKEEELTVWHCRRWPDASSWAGCRLWA